MFDFAKPTVEETRFSAQTVREESTKLCFLQKKLKHLEHLIKACLFLLNI